MYSEIKTDDCWTERWLGPVSSSIVYDRNPDHGSHIDHFARLCVGERN